MSDIPGLILTSGQTRVQEADLIPNTFRHPSNMSTPEISSLFRRSHIDYLRQINGNTIRSMQSELEHQRQVISGLAAVRDRLVQKLEQESAYRAMADQALAMERNSNQDMATTIANLRQEILLSRNAFFASRGSLESEQKRLHDMALELDYVRRKFYLVDSLVDTMLLEEDSELDFGDRSRPITEVILGLESQMEGKYRALIDEKDTRIDILESGQSFPVENERFLDTQREQD